MEDSTIDILKIKEQQMSFEEMMLKIQTLYGWSPRKTKRAIQSKTFLKKLHEEK